MTTPDMKAAALGYATRGWPVFPCRADKSPLTSHGFKEASTDRAVIEQWWGKYPDALIGLPTGEQSGVWVLDVDDPEAFAAAGVELPETMRVDTGKGFHLYFRHSPARVVRNRARLRGLPGTDVRGDGGYVIVPPSRHPSGTHYAYANDNEPVEAPAALMEIVTRASNAPRELPAETHMERVWPQVGVDTPYGLAALERESQAISQACEGEQENTLNNASLKMGALVAGGALSEGSAKRALLAAGLAMRSYDSRNPWTAEAILEKVTRGLADGTCQPRAAPVRENRDMAWGVGADHFDPETGEVLSANDNDEIETLDWSTLARAEPTPKQFVIPGLAPAGEVTLFTGPGSAGKSLLGQQLATAIAVGKPTLGLDMGQAPALYVTCEDDAEQLHWRQHHICKALGVRMEALCGRLWMASLRGRLDNALGTADREGNFKLSGAFHRLAALIRRKGAALVFLDNLSHLFTGNENDRGEVTRFANALNRMAGETGAAIVLLGHTPKAFSQGNTKGNHHSGSTAWLNAVRSQFTLEHDLETDVRTLTVGKANYARNGESLRFVWNDWAFVREDDLPPDNRRALDETIQANGDNKLFLDCLRERNREGRAVSEKTCSTYAPKVFAGMPESKGIGKVRLEKAMDRLFRIGLIERGKLWRDGHRKWVEGLREQSAAGDLYLNDS